MFDLGPQESGYALSSLMLLFLFFGWRQTNFRLTAIASIVLAGVAVFLVNDGYRGVSTTFLLTFIFGLALMYMAAYGVGRLVYGVFASGRKSS